MFSMTPAMRWCVCEATAPARSATSAAASCGVVTTSSSALGSRWPTEIATSPVPGGRSSSSTSRSPQYTSPRNCSSARCRIGPRHGTGSLALVNMPTEMTFTPCADGGMIIFSTWVGSPSTPSMRGTEKPYMSASSTPTCWPLAASAAARFTVTDDLPTPPLPLATANTRVSEVSSANGFRRSGRPPRSWLCSARRCSSLITSRPTRTPVTPASWLTAAVTSRVMVSRIGQPATVSQTSTRTVPSGLTSTSLTMPSSVIGRWISGSLTRESASVTCSVVGGTADGVAMAPWYEPSRGRRTAAASRGGKIPLMDLQPIGLRHPAAELIRDIQHNRTGLPRRMFVAEGLWEHNLLLASGARLDTFLWCPEAAYSDEARTRAPELAARARRAYQVSAKTLERLSERPSPDGLLSAAQLPDWEPETVRLRPDALILVADGMEIPGNRGTLIRTLDACAADCLVLTNRRTRLTHPKVLRSSQGMSMTVPALEFAEVADAIAWLRGAGATVYLAETGGPVSYRDADYSGRTALVVGSERYGLAPAWQAEGLSKVSVPMLGPADSLNVSVSASVLLYEARARQDGW